MPTTSYDDLKTAIFEYLDLHPDTPPTFVDNTGATGVETTEVTVPCNDTIEDVKTFVESLDGKYFTVYDDAGSVAIWFAIDFGEGANTAEPSHGADRSIKVEGLKSITEGDKYKGTEARIQIVDITVSAIEADSELSALLKALNDSVDPPVAYDASEMDSLTITYEPASGVADADAGTSGLTITVKEKGGADIGDGFHDDYPVEDPENGNPFAITESQVNDSLKAAALADAIDDYLIDVLTNAGLIVSTVVALDPPLSGTGVGTGSGTITPQTV